ncbi:MAG: TRM11 family methyltransferase [Bacteroidia bacterium]
MKKHIYFFGYHQTESELCKLESRYIFNEEEKDKLLFSDIETDPSCSAFIKKRLDIISFSEDYATLIQQIKEANICMEGFKAEYVMYDGDTTEYTERLEKLKDVGYSIEGEPDYYSPTITYGLCHLKGVWFLGVLIKNDFAWHKHKEKPCSYSNSISTNIAKAIVNIAAKADKEKKLLDACCGVGTIMLEACFAGHNIEGCDINWKVCKNAVKNLAHFNYTANVYCSDIKDISERYDAAIIDLPYNLLSRATEDDVLHIIESTAAITDHLIIVSTSDITRLISSSGFRIADYCSVRKKGKSYFARKIWVCEKGV